LTGIPLRSIPASDPSRSAERKEDTMSDQKQRHGCLTAFLILMIIANSVSTIMYLLGSSYIKQTLPNAPSWLFPVLAVLGIFNLVCAIALFKWKKWGFWGFCASAVAALIINISTGVGIAPSLVGLIGVAILFGSEPGGHY